MTRRADFPSVTEQWGMPVSARQLAMARCRYDLAAGLVAGRVALEIGCGTGVGLDYLRGRAQKLVGGDFSQENLLECRRNVPVVPVMALDAHALPFRDGSVHVVILLEVIYYVADQARALDECHRVLRPGGDVVLAWPNPESPGFHASPFSTAYPSAARALKLLSGAGFDAEVFGGFTTIGASGTERLVRAATGLASRLGLMPRTLAGRGRLKRLVYGSMTSLGDLRSAQVTYDPLVRIHADGAEAFTNLYAVGHRR